MEEKILIKGIKKEFPKSFSIISIVCIYLFIILYRMDYQPFFIYIALLVSVILIGAYIAFKNGSITVTDKRVYGKSLFSNRVDIPIDTISAVGTTMFNGVIVSSSSGRIRFFNLDNNVEIHKTINNLLIERQAQHKSSTITKGSENNVADEIIKYKELLDAGAITQEEYDAKKKKLLDL